MCAPAFSAGGAVRNAAAIARAAGDAGVGVTVLVGKRETEHDIRNLFERVAPDAAVVEVAGGAVMCYLRVIRELVRRTLRTRDAIVLTGYPQALGAVMAADVLRRRAGRSVYLIQGSGVSSALGRAQRALHAAFYRLALADPRLEIAATTRAVAREELARFGQSEREGDVTVIGNVAIAVGDGPWIDRTTTKPQPAPDGGSLSVLGRLSHEKGVDVAIAAVALLPEPYSLTVAGDGPEAARLKSMVDREGLQGRVRFAGWCSPVDILGTTTVLLIPSRSEGFSLALLEALWFGRTVVASDLAALREVSGGASSVRFFPAGDSRALAEAVLASHQAPLKSDPPHWRWDRFAAGIENLVAG